MRFNPRDNRERQRGSAMVLFITLLAFVLIPIAGLAIDASIMYVVKSKLVTAVDAASLAAGRSLSASSCSSSDTSTQQIAAAYAEANFPPGTMGAPTPVVNTTASCDPATKIRKVTVQGTVAVPLLFARIFGSTSTTVSASGTSSRRDVNVILVLDRSSSMGGNTCTVMKNSAQNFVNMFTDGRDTLGLVTFMVSPNVDYQPSQNFKTASTTLSSVIGKLVCGGNTGSAAALHTAYLQIQAINKPGALNVVVFFTDGLPNGVTAKFPIKSTSSCQPTSDGFLDGAIEQVNNDVDTGQKLTSGVQPAAGPNNIASTNQGVINAPGCAFMTNQNNMKLDVDYIPWNDLGGNPTYQGYKVLTAAQTITVATGPEPGSHARVDIPTAITYASINAADAQARTIRKDTTYQTVIYVIGLGGTSSEPLDQDFLQRVANVPNGPNPSDTNDPSQAQGYYVYSPTAGQLGSAFQTIASQILHLSQ